MSPLSSKMVIAHVCPSLSPAARSHYVCLTRSGMKSHTVGRDTLSNFAQFRTGRPLRTSICRRTFVSKASDAAIRCEQSSEKGNSLAVALGRLAMVGFAALISVEIGAGKGLLENLGLMAPLPTVFLVIVSVMGILAAVFIFQSASEY